MKKLDKHTIEELVELRDDISSRIRNYTDGFFYICNIRSYGSVIKQNIPNSYELQELCHQYDGDHGIVDVYTNNPNMGTLDNYGPVMFVETEDDYDKWNRYVRLKSTIKSIGEELDKWEDRDNLPFRSRPSFEPSYSREELGKLKEKVKLIGPFSCPWNLRNSNEA
tara:strand:+ start:1120 stop:1617 length:498 start_codon:yes stop_codon:yes gene_type:complete